MVLLVRKLCFWANEYGKRRCRKAYWRVRAELRRTIRNTNKQRQKFQYDASSYALNFDDAGSSRYTGNVVYFVDDTRLFAFWFLHFVYKAAENYLDKEQADPKT